MEKNAHDQNEQTVIFELKFLPDKIEGVETPGFWNLNLLDQPGNNSA